MPGVGTSLRCSRAPYPAPIVGMEGRATKPRTTRRSAGDRPGFPLRTSTTGMFPFICMSTRKISLLGASPGQSSHHLVAVWLREAKQVAFDSPPRSAKGAGSHHLRLQPGNHFVGRRLQAATYRPAPRAEWTSKKYWRSSPGHRSPVYWDKIRRMTTAFPSVGATPGRFRQAESVPFMGRCTGVSPQASKAMAVESSSTR